MAQIYMSHHEDSDATVYRAWTDGSPGADSWLPDDRLVNFIHTDDPVTMAPLVGAGSIFALQTLGSYLASKGLTSSFITELLNNLEVAAPKHRVGTDILLDSDVSSLPTNTDEHNKDLYTTDVIRLLDAARAGGPFADTPIAQALLHDDPVIAAEEPSEAYHGNAIQIGVGAPGTSEMHSQLTDDFILGSSQNDVISISGSSGQVPIIDGEAGFDTVRVPGIESAWRLQTSGDETDLYLKGGPGFPDILVAKLINIEKVQFASSSRLIKGYISGATVFSDDNGNGKLDPSEASTTTDATGGFTISDGTGPLTAFGGTDTSTGLSFKGQLTAPAGSTDITPLTSLLTGGALDAVAQQKILTALGLSSTLDLTSFDPIASAQSGSADGASTEIAGAKIYDTVETIASDLAGAGGTFSHAFQDAFAALASALGGVGFNLGDRTALSTLITHIATAESVTLGTGVADAIASIIAAGNKALDHVLQIDQPGNQLLSDAAGVELVMQGAASTAITNAGGSLPKLEAIADLFSGTNLDKLIAQAQTETQNPGQDLGPIAFDDSATTDQNTVLDGAVSAIDLLGNVITYALDGSAPAGLTFNPDGTFSFDPGSAYKYLAVGESAKLSFQFTTSDGHGTDGKATETITITGLNDSPAIDAPHTTATGTITELPNTTGGQATDSIADKIAFADPDLTDRPTATIDSQHETVTYQDSSGHTYALTAAQIAAFEDALKITAETGNINSGKIDWTYSIADKALDFLGTGERITVTAPVVIDDHNGGSVAQNVVVTLNGSNDNPTPVVDTNGAVKGTSISVSAAKGVLANDSDPDLHDHLSVSAVNGSLANVGSAIHGNYGSLTLNADGSYIYSSDKGSLPSQIVAQDNFTYSVSDGHGGSTASTLSVLVFNPSMVYQGGANTTVVSNGIAPTVLDGSAGHDMLVGGIYSDVLVGGSGDKLTGGGGPDTFVFRPDFGANTITDFNVNNSAIQFDKFIFASVADILAHTSNSAQGAVISDSHGDTLTLADVTLAQLQAHQSDFHLA
jgi:VCBS repeat-containing protein